MLKTAHTSLAGAWRFLKCSINIVNSGYIGGAADIPLRHFKVPAATLCEALQVQTTTQRVFPGIFSIRQNIADSVSYFSKVTISCFVCKKIYFYSTLKKRYYNMINNTFHLSHSLKKTKSTKALTACVCSRQQRVWRATHFIITVQILTDWKSERVTALFRRSRYVLYCTLSCEKDGVSIWKTVSIRNLSHATKKFQILTKGFLPFLSTEICAVLLYLNKT